MRALVTGASSGIGRCMCEVLARDYGCDLILVSNQMKALLETAGEMESMYHVHTHVLCTDLASVDSADKVLAFTRERDLCVDILINDAGFFFFREFVGVPPQTVESMLVLHMVTTAKLTRLFGEEMCRRGKGYILNMSSLCAWMHFPGIQTYCSTKAFVYNFSRSVRHEFKLHGVSVTVVTPGAVDTSLYGLDPKLRRLAVKLGISITPQRLAVKALRRMFAGRKDCMPGLINHIARPLLGHLPDWAVSAILRKVAKKYAWEI